MAMKTAGHSQQKQMERFNNLEALAFDEDVNIAFSGSIHLAQEVGVEEDKILHDVSQIDNYFLL